MTDNNHQQLYKSVYKVKKKATKYLSRMVLIYFGQQRELFEVNACMFVQSAIT